MGKALYPHPQWKRLAALWESFYPTRELDKERQALLALLEESIPSFVTLLTNHQPRSLAGRTLGDVMAVTDHQPDRLAAIYQAGRAAPGRLRAAPPSLAFAVLGQARADGLIGPEAEGNMIASLLTGWALHSSLDTTARCVTLGPSKRAIQLRRSPDRLHDGG
jgi:hypothetical protein